MTVSLNEAAQLNPDSQCAGGDKTALPLLGTNYNYNRRRAFLPCLKARGLQPEDFDDKAIVDYSEAIKLKPDYAEAYNNRARTYLKKVDFDKAIEDYTKAIELNPQDVDAYYTRGKLYDMNKSNDDRTP